MDLAGRTMFGEIGACVADFDELCVWGVSFGWALLVKGIDCTPQFRYRRLVGSLGPLKQIWMRWVTEI